MTTVADTFHPFRETESCSESLGQQSGRVNDHV